MAPRIAEFPAAAATNFSQAVRPLAPEAERRRRLATRAFPLAIIAVVSLVAGVVVGASPPPERQAAERFVRAWARQQFAAMRAELNPESKRRYTTQNLRDAYVKAEEKATLHSLDPADAEGPTSSGGQEVVTIPIRVGTMAFGSFDSELRLPFADGGIAWDAHLVFPGLRRGEQLANSIALAKRGAILARDGTPLAEGPAEARSSPLGSAAINVAGEVGQPDPADLPALARQGFPAGTPVGISGLEQAFNSRLAGKPGGELIARSHDGTDRVLAKSDPLPGKLLHTTVDPDLQQVAVAGLAGRAGGVVALDARSGAVRALAGSAFSAPQPPGSTFKLVTTTAALQKGVVSLDDEFPITNGINVGGRFISNAHGEYCGGSFTQAFAESCNAVFAPLGPKIGNDQLVATAERYGFNSKPALYDAAATRITDPPESSIPEEIGDDLDLGVSAIGQGEVLATPLEMAMIAQTVARRGVRSPTPIVTEQALQADAGPVRVMSRKIAAQLRDLMIGVVTSGTGTAAALPGVQVAGKTGTAELGPKPGAPAPAPGELPEQAVDAWFTCFAPAGKPRLVVAVMLVDADADGGTVAAPVAHDVLATGLLG
jgi:Penicillin binding protein transpeptidase domain/Penicillin-binding Protein dimerisation domain/NTF2-like N-terminal transpeptidase domain